MEGGYFVGKILVIDDSPTAFRMVQLALEQDGHEVTLLPSFTQLAATLETLLPDVILLDLQMPAMSGKATGHFIRRYQARPTPIVVYSAQEAAEVRSAAEAVGAAATLRKCDDRSVSQATIRRVLTRAGQLSTFPAKRA